MGREGCEGGVREDGRGRSDRGACGARSGLHSVPFCNRAAAGLQHEHCHPVPHNSRVPCACALTSAGMASVPTARFRSTMFIDLRSGTLSRAPLALLMYVCSQRSHACVGTVHSSWSRSSWLYVRW